MKNLFNILVIGLLASAFSYISIAQTKSNLDVFYSLTDSLVYKISSEIPSTNNEILLQLHPGNVYSVFNNEINSAFITAGKKVREVPPDEFNIPTVDIVIESASVNYGDVFKDGWFGSYYTVRELNINGNYLQSFSETGKQEFNLEYADTINVDQITELENENFTFTKSKIPSEPFISGLVEPLLAVGTAAAMVILFFSIRSK